MAWHVKPTIIDEYVPAARDAFHVVNDDEEIADDSVYEDFDAAQALADELNLQEVSE